MPSDATRVRTAVRQMQQKAALLAAYKQAVRKMPITHRSLERVRVVQEVLARVLSIKDKRKEGTP